MKICYLIGAGDFNTEIDKKPCDLIIAADGGYDNLIQHGYAPDIVIGDFDSSAANIPENIPKITFPSEKNETDMFLAYLEGVKRGYTDFVILGALGGERIDHTIANISLLEYICEQEHNAKIQDEKCDIYCIENKKLTLHGKTGNFLSVFAVGGSAARVTIRGAKYEITDTTLTPLFPLGVSNEFLSSECTVSVGVGKLLIVVSKKSF